MQRKPRLLFVVSEVFALRMALRLCDLCTVLCTRARRTCVKKLSSSRRPYNFLRP